MARKLISDFERFRRKIRIEGEFGCWTWEATLDRDGYAAQAKIGSRTDGSRRVVRPHRWMYEHIRGPIPAGLVIDHLCRNRACINPDHLETVTPEENSHRRRAARKICPKGHALSGDNALLTGGALHCRVCTNEYQRKYQGAVRRRFAEAKKQEAENRLG